MFNVLSIFVTKSIFFILGFYVLFMNVNLSANEKNIKLQTPPTTDEILKEIEPFVDNGTVLVCYIDCAAMNEINKLSIITKSALNLNDNIIGTNVKNTLKQINLILDNMEVKNNSGYFSNLLDCDITHFYIVFNIKYKLLGAFYVIPSIGNDGKKIVAAKKFFHVKDKKEISKTTLTWIHTKDNYLIVGGSTDVVLMYFSHWFVLPAMMPEGFSSIASHYTDEFKYLMENECLTTEKSFSKYRNDIFKNYKPQYIPSLRLAFDDLKNDNAIKLILLVNDITTAEEFLWSKKMNTIREQVTLDFVRKSRKYVILSIDTNSPCIKIRVKTDSVEKSKKFQQYLIGQVQAKVAHQSASESGAPDDKN
jgi:hypothetical protein